MDQLLSEYIKIGVSILATLITLITGYKSFIDLKKGKKEIENSHSNILDSISNETHSIENHSIEKRHRKSSAAKFHSNKASTNNHLDLISFSKKAQKTLDNKKSFEITQLENYYSQVLSQSKNSFWFSLVFASIGFVIIIISGFLYNSDNMESTVISMTSGVIIDSVSALFFVQTKRAQKNMTDFFQKLREDKQYVESKYLCDSISSDKARDALKIQLALNFAGIDNSKDVGTEIISQIFH